MNKRFILTVLLFLVCLSGCVGNDSMPDRLINKSEDEIIDEIAAMPDNDIDIGFSSLVIAKGYYPEIDIKKYLSQLDTMARELKEKIGNENNPEEIITIINQYLFETKNIRMSSQTLTEAYKNEAKEAFLNNLLDTGIGNCTAMSALYLALAERLRLPFYTARIPDHVFIRYDDGKFKRNIETTDHGKEGNDAFYIKFAENNLGTGKLVEDDIKYYKLLENESKKSFLEGLLRIRAKVRYNDGNKKEAYNDWQKTIKLSDNLGATYAHIAIELSYFVNEKNNDEALIWINKAIEVSPQYYLFYQYRGRIYDAKNDLENALRDCNKAIELNKSQPVSYRARARIYEKKKDYDKALADIEKEIELMPDTFSPHFGRALLLWRKKEYNESLKELKVVIEINPDYAMAYYMNGLIYKETGESEQAISNFEKYLKLAPDGQYAKTVKDYIKELEAPK